MNITTTQMPVQQMPVQQLPNSDHNFHGGPLDDLGTHNSAAIIAATDHAALGRLPSSSALVDTAQAWAADVAQESMLANCTTIGLVSGSRHATPRCVIDGYARLIADAFSVLRPRRPMLIVRLSARPVAASRRDNQQADLAPKVTASPLGPWSEVSISIAAGKRARVTLESLSYLLPDWKAQFGFILVDLGSISEAPSRLIGGHCDSCFVLLGPESCGSHEWLLQQIAWHARSGSTICGTLVTELE